ncbi:MAG: hypothetical protein PHQ54_02115 [Candidatus Omnitrophica bacterium]|nr:hypothetical protein [Candidatus Omnitrophota bacterium]
MLAKPQIDISYDSPRYLITAQSIAYGNGYNFIYRPDNAPVFYNNYILPYFLAPLIRAFGINPYVLKAVMLLLGLFALFFFLSWVKIYLKEKELLFLFVALIYTPLFIKFCDKILTEALFVFFLTASFLLLRKYSVSKKKSCLILLFICCYCAIFTKITGIFILIPLFVYSKSDKDKKLILSTAILLAATIITVFIIQSRLLDNDKFYHIKYLLYKNAFTPDLGYIKPSDLLLRIIYNIRFYFFSLPAGIISNDSTLKIMPFLFWPTLVLGMKNKRSLERRAILSFFVCYAVFFLAWPWQDNRFFYPLLFIKVFYLYLGAEKLLRKTGLKLKKIIYLLILMSIILSGTGELLAKFTTERAYPAQVDEFISLARWLENNLDNDSVVLSQNPALIYLIASKKGVKVPYSYNLEKISLYIKENNVSYILADRFNWEMIRYIYPWVNQNKEKLQIIKTFGETALFSVLNTEERGELF